MASSASQRKTPESASAKNFCWEIFRVVTAHGVFDAQKSLKGRNSLPIQQKWIRYKSDKFTSGKQVPDFCEIGVLKIPHRGVKLQLFQYISAIKITCLST